MPVKLYIYENHFRRKTAFNEAAQKAYNDPRKPKVVVSEKKIIYPNYIEVYEMVQFYDHFRGLQILSVYIDESVTNEQMDDYLNDIIYPAMRWLPEYMRSDLWITMNGDPYDFRKT